jgi:hypothetical protein
MVPDVLGSAEDEVLWVEVPEHDVVPIDLCRRDDGVQRGRDCDVVGAALV